MTRHFNETTARLKPTYNPDNLLDTVIRKKGLRFDAQLGRLLGVGRSTICKIRSRHLGVSAEIMLRIHEVCDIPIRELRSLVGDH